MRLTLLGNATADRVPVSPSNDKFPNVRVSLSDSFPKAVDDNVSTTK